MVGGDAGIELSEELGVAEHGEVGGVDRPEAGVDDLADPLALLAGGEPGTGRRGGAAASSHWLRLKMK